MKTRRRNWKKRRTQKRLEEKKERTGEGRRDDGALVVVKVNVTRRCYLSRITATFDELPGPPQRHTATPPPPPHKTHPFIAAVTSLPCR
ncbi:hypothetical protein E2C01_088684 [Portunus trituberculatus]|uniref:Uncharacterized protein n=1 Tax=Portunus trituberculatus TaxID=210409 RepID=A0A5B7J6U1_PORTR|nr:hypothetical protein [Portunus trituberculatus]